MLYNSHLSEPKHTYELIFTMLVGSVSQPSSYCFGETSNLGLQLFPTLIDCIASLQSFLLLKTVGLESRTTSSHLWKQKHEVKIVNL